MPADDPVEPARAEAARRTVPAHIPKGTSCFTGRYARVASAFPHFGEEDCLRGWNGSGTIFFSFCKWRVDTRWRRRGWDRASGAGQ